MLSKYKEGLFHSKWLSKFINYWFFSGKTFKIEKILYYSFFLIKYKLNCCPLYLFFEGLEKIKPVIGLKMYKQKRRKVNKIIAVPFVMNFLLRYKKALTWLSVSIKLRNNQKKLSSRIFFELRDICINNNSLSIKKKKEYYKYAIQAKVAKKFKW